MFGFKKQIEKDLTTQSEALIQGIGGVDMLKNSQPMFSFSTKKQRSIFKVKIHGNNEIEQSLYLFRNIKFNDKVKFLIFRAITSGEAANILIGGPKGAAKTEMVESVADACYDVLYINSKTTIAGLIKAIQENPNIRIIIFDEADKILDKGEKDDIRGFLSTGKLTRTLKSGNIEIEIKNLVTIMTANNVEKFDGPFLSRFTRIYLPEYTDEQFKEICAFRMPEYNQEMIYEIAQELINQKMKDVRNMVRLRSFIKPTDSFQMVEMILNTVIEYENTTTKNVNWDKK